MKRNWDFHESYYEHGCSVVAEQDVLESDIRGNSTLTKLRRWWHGLFLLSYSNRYSRAFYASSHTMRKERQMHYRKFRGRIHPFSDFRSALLIVLASDEALLVRTFWDIFIFLVIMMDDLACHHNFSILYGFTLRYLYYLGAVLDFIIISDIFVNLSSGYSNYKTKTVVMDPRLSVMHYCSTKICLHAASAIPLQWLLFMRFGYNFDCSLCKTTKFMCALELWRFFTLFRIYECSKFMSVGWGNLKVTYILKFLRIAILGFFTLLQFLEMEKVITLRIMVEQGYITQNSNIGLLLTFKIQTGNHDEVQDAYLLFIFNFSHVLRSMFLISFFYKIDMYYLDRIFRMIACIITNIFFLWTIGESLALVFILKFPEDRNINILVSLRLMESRRQMPDKVSARVAKYYCFKFARLRAVEIRNHLYRHLPTVLKQEIFMECYAKFITKIPYFEDWPTAIKRNLVFLLKEEIYMKNELVADPYVQSEGLLIVVSGELAVYAGDTETGHIIDGDFFGELSLVTDREVRVSSVVALTPCLLLSLRKSTFRQYMRTYPDLFFEMKDQLRKKYEAKRTTLEPQPSVTSRLTEQETDEPSSFPKK